MNLLTLVRFKYSDLMTILKMCLRICLRFRYRTKGSIKGDGKRLCGDKRCIRENYSVLWPIFLGGVLCGLERSEKSLSVLNPRCSSARTRINNTLHTANCQVSVGLQGPCTVASYRRSTCYGAMSSGRPRLTQL